MARCWLRLACLAAALLAWRGDGCSKCPSRSDVVFTSRSPRYVGDPVEGLTTWQAMEDFDATRLDWVYTTNASFIAEAHRRGMSVVTPAMNANLPDPGSAVNHGIVGTHSIGRCKNIHNQSLSAPWMAPGQFKPGSPNYVRSAPPPPPTPIP
eukprot:COSAG04_NODE_9946_length_818_cov_0.948540_1_plen_151_part_01